ncbi:C2H2 type zinc-finger-domain-containing protein [Vararia minispora EC-137]|uniref:C2H2 type zinc-finger-domain-containing protein n=1 Tax=Vararia minispora EC-137 TaxID=1314806 RepID=A0ACB8QVY4_9AGAM|nr:C2H2 type zinc-finger-domain-containing protein [Vararia minispora EC-137]
MQLDGQQLFTCLSCTIAFLTAEEQRVHYRSDHHRYNMKRRVAGLPPVSVAVFNQKILERRQETAVMLSPKGSTCETCNKSYTTENAYRSHMQSKKHKENEFKVLSQPKLAAESETMPALSADADEPIASTSTTSLEPATSHQNGASLTVNAEATEEEVNLTLDQKIAAARSRLSPAHCLFCTSVSPSLEENLTHMSLAHSFFIPDAEYLVDLPGLITYLGEKVAVGNVCLYCNGRGREFRTIEAVRKHMVDKSHCKIAYEREADMLEIADFYDFTTSYPDWEERAKRKEEKRRLREERRQEREARAAEDEWEDDEDVEGDADEVVDEVTAPEDSDTEESDEDESSDEDSLPDNQITYGDSSYELVLPNGRRLVHRSMARYVKQRHSLTVRSPGSEDPKSGAALVRRLLADKNSALVPRKGGFGAFGAGTDVVKARNAGEAREAGRHVREFRDQRRREQFKTAVGFKHNHQKHYRDPLLQ